MPVVDQLPESLQTDRLLIRVARPGDGAMLGAAIADSHAELAPWLGWVTSPLTTDERNLRSRALAERAGFELEGTLRKDRLDLEGRLRNTRVYAMVG